MSYYYQTVNTKVDPVSGTISYNDELLTLRPKTLQLLLMLLEANSELVSKEVMLATIWDDVVVDDQVVFQSIKEIRKQFGDHSIIRTVPRKGYAWAAPIERVEHQQTPESAITTPANFNSRLWTSIAILVVVLIGFIFYRQPPSHSEQISGSVIVLPFHNQVQGTDHKWVRIGAMDQLIQGLYSTNNAGVLQTDYVFDVMTRAKMPLNHYDSHDIHQVFKVSGANLVIESTLTGSPSDYQLLYRLHYRNNVEQGSIFSENVSEAITTLTTIVGKRLDPDFVFDRQLQSSSLSNGLLVSAIEQKHAGKPKQAIHLLEAVVTNDPNNTIALRLLGQTMVENANNLTRAAALLTQGIKLARLTDNHKELARLYFWQAVNYLQQGDIALARQWLYEADNVATRINDWLYLAYSEEIKGQIYQYQQDFSNAKSAFKKAMDYHQVLQCPLGYSNGLMNLSQLAYTQNQLDNAINFANESLNVVEQRELYLKRPIVEKWLAKLRNLKLGEIQQQDGAR